jgi:hypothetical protein
VITLNQCTAHSKRSGERCRNASINGHHVCRLHGGSTPQVKRVAAQRVAISQLMQRELTDDEKRDPGAILLNAVQLLDQVMLTGRFDNEGAWIEHVVTVAKTARMLIDSTAYAKIAARQDRDLAMEGRVVADVMVATVDQLIDSIPFDDEANRVAWRGWAVACLFARLSGNLTPERPASMELRQPGQVVDVKPAETRRELPAYLTDDQDEARVPYATSHIAHHRTSPAHISPSHPTAARDDDPRPLTIQEHTPVKQAMTGALGPADDAR